MSSGITKVTYDNILAKLIKHLITQYILLVFYSLKKDTKFYKDLLTVSV